MAISVNWGTKVISVPKVDMSLVQVGPPEIRELDLNDFRLALKALEDDQEGIAYPDIISHNTEVILGNLTLARVIEIINGYTVTFEDGNYQVDLVGANSNVSDVTNLNSVGLRSYNSAGLIVTGGADPSEVADAVLDSLVEGSITLQQAQRLMIAVLANKSSGGDTINIKFRDVADSKNRVDETVDENGNRTAVSLDLS